MSIGMNHKATYIAQAVQLSRQLQEIESSDEYAQALAVIEQANQIKAQMRDLGLKVGETVEVETGKVVYKPESVSHRWDSDILLALADVFKPIMNAYKGESRRSAHTEYRPAK